MKIYHGTSANNLESILKAGIRPRSVTNKETNFPNCPSHENYVHLTKVYAAYFGYNACENGEDVCIFEVDLNCLDKDFVCPDQDFIGTVLAHQNNTDLIETTLSVEPYFYRQYLQESLDNLGTCCYMGEVPIEAITRYALINQKKNAQLLSIAMQPTITVINYKICGNYYQNLTQHIFDGIPLKTMQDALLENQDYNITINSSVGTLLKEQKQGLAKLSENRDIIVINLSNYES